MLELTGRVAVVTGAGSGIGRALAVALGAEGMRLVLADVDAAALDATAEQLRATGAAALTVPTDVRDGEAVDRLAQATVGEYGAVHVVCNNAGVSRMGHSWEMPLADWQWVLDVNLWGVINGVRSFVPHLIRQPEAHIVNTASAGGLMPVPFLGPYTAAKHAVVGLTKALRLELAEAAPHVGVSLLCPGRVATAMELNTARGDDEPENLPPGAARRRRAEQERSSAGKAMDPAHVAVMTVRAIRAGGFYLLPNGDEFLPLLREDFDAVLTAPTR